jgi:Domain of unknown function (DUF222)
MNEEPLGGPGAEDDRAGSPSGADHLDEILLLTSQIAGLEARRLVVVEKLSRSEEMVPFPPRVRPDGSTYRPLRSWDLAHAELKAALHLGDRDSARLLDTGIALVERYHGTAATLASGRLDYRRAALIPELTQPLADHHALQARRAGKSPEQAERAALAIVAEVEALVLEDAPGQTWWELRLALLKALFTVDPEFAELTRARAQRSRTVTARTNPDDATGDIWAHLSAAETQAIYTVIDGYARLARSRGDRRTLAQLRADAFASICLNGELPEPGRPAAEAADANETDDQTDGAADKQADGGAHDEAGAGPSRERAAAYLPIPEPDEFDDVPLDPAFTADQDDDRDCPGCADPRPASGRHPMPDRTDDDRSAEAPRAPEDRRPRAPERDPAEGDSLSRRTVRRRAGVRAHVQVLIDLATLLDLRDHPGHLEKHGPITAHYARALATLPGGLYRRLITDPATGRLLDRAGTTYRPAAALRDHVIARDQTCRHPGCTRPAVVCDTDHIVPYPAGATCEENLCSNCRHDHRLKHEGRWRHRRSTDPDHTPGTVIYTSPTGRQFISRPAQLTRPTPAGARPDLRRQRDLHPQEDLYPQEDLHPQHGPDPQHGPGPQPSADPQPRNATRPPTGTRPASGISSALSAPMPPPGEPGRPVTRYRDHPSCWRRRRVPVHLVGNQQLPALLARVRRRPHDEADLIPATKPDVTSSFWLGSGPDPAPVPF